MRNEYVVASGDTLSGICKKIYGRVDDQVLKQVMAYNNITNANKINVGQVLRFSNNEPVKIVQLAQPTVSPSTAINKIDFSEDILIKELASIKYFQKEFPKDMIVLHLTAGYNWQGAYNTFANGIATPFIVDKSGPKYIVKLFDEKFWAYHLGQKEYTNNWGNDKRSIGIEVVNVGPVWLEGGAWKDCWQKKSGRGITLEENIIKGMNRDAQGGAIFLDKQVVAVCNLVNYLCDKWNIPRQVPRDKMAFQLPKLNNFKGITAHMMFRNQGKYDMGPAWPWQRMIELCNLKEVEI